MSYDHIFGVAKIGVGSDVRNARLDAVAARLRQCGVKVVKSETQYLPYNIYEITFPDESTRLMALLAVGNVSEIFSGQTMLVGYTYVISTDFNEFLPETVKGLTSIMEDLIKIGIVVEIDYSAKNHATIEVSFPDKEVEMVATLRYGEMLDIFNCLRTYHT